LEGQHHVGGKRRWRAEGLLGREDEEAPGTKEGLLPIPKIDAGKAVEIGAFGWLRSRKGGRRK
jgi:hypothetical protein